MPGSDPDLAGTDEGHLPLLTLSHAPSAINHTTNIKYMPKLIIILTQLQAPQL